MSAFYQRISSG